MTDAMDQKGSVRFAHWTRLAAPELEKRFRLEALPEDSIQIRAVLAYTLVAIGGLLFLESLFMERANPLYVSAAARCATLLATFVAFWVVSRNPGVRFMDRVVLVWICVLAAHMVVLNAVRPGDYVAILAWDTLTIFAIYTVLPVPPLLQAMPAMILAIGGAGLWLLRGHSDLGPFVVVAVPSAYIFASGYGIYMSIRHNRSRRRQFVLALHEKEIRADLEAAMEERLKSEETLDTIVNTIQAGIMIVDAESHRIVSANPKALAAIGLPHDQVIGHVCHEFVCSAKEGNCPITDGGKEIDSSESVLLTGTGTKVPILKTVTRAELHGRDHLVETFLDIRERKALENRLRELATTDPLTGLCNRRQFIELAEHELTRAERYETPISLVSFDIDHFKSINDTYGHATGDAVLRGLAGPVKSHLRDSDIIGRLGGEEFSILLISSDLNAAVRVAERIRAGVEALVIEQDGESIRFTISLGVAQFAGNEEDLNGMMKRADKALYEAKESGRNRVCMAE